MGPIYGGGVDQTLRIQVSAGMSFNFGIISYVYHLYIIFISPPKTDMDTHKRLG